MKQSSSSSSSGDGDHGSMTQPSAFQVVESKQADRRRREGTGAVWCGVGEGKVKDNKNFMRLATVKQSNFIIRRFM